MAKRNEWNALLNKPATRKTGAGAVNARPAEDGEARSSDLAGQRQHFALCSVLRSEEWDHATITHVTDNVAVAWNIKQKRYFRITVQIQ